MFFEPEKWPSTYQLSPAIHHKFTIEKPRSAPRFCQNPQQKRVNQPRKKTAKKRPLSVRYLLGWGESQGVVIFFEGEAEGFDDEVVVVALGQAGDGDGADDACAGDVDGEAAAVGGVVGVG